MVFNAAFNNISVILWRSVLLVEETEEPGENHRPVTSHWQIWSHNVVDLALIKIRIIIGICQNYIIWYVKMIIDICYVKIIIDIWYVKIIIGIWYVKIIIDIWYVKIIIDIWYVKIIIDIWYVKIIIGIWYVKMIIDIWYVKIIIGIWYVKMIIDIWYVKIGIPPSLLWFIILDTLTIHQYKFCLSFLIF
jgi:hypothetical protein